MTTQIRSKRILLVMALFTMLILFALVFFFCSSPVATAYAAEETTYTTTDRLYLRLPNHDATFTFEMYADTVNGGNVNHEGAENIVTYSSATISVNNWYDVYLKFDNGKKWNVPKSAAEDGKFYFDPNIIGFNTSVSLYVDIGPMNTGNSGGTLSFIENGDKLYRWTSTTTAAAKLGVTNYIASPGFSVSTQRRYLTDSIYWNINTWTVNSSLIGWNVNGPDDFATGYGLNPTQGTFQIARGLQAGQTHNLNIAYTVGAINSNWIYGRCQLAHRSKNAYTYNETIELDLRSDAHSPQITLSDEFSKTSVSASWTDDSYSYATYRFNDTDYGEYKKDTVLRTEGRYLFIVTDCTGNVGTKTVYVDRTAPKFSSEFYDAANMPIVLKSNIEAKVTWEQPGVNESPIKSCTYVRQFYDAATNSIKSDVAKSYTENSKLTAEGKYTFTLQDSAGNTSTATYIVDKTAPTITASNIASKTSVSASTRYSDAETAITMTYSLNGASAVSYRSGQSLSLEGKYIITATDEAGNSSSLTLYVDKTAPELKISQTASAESVKASWTVATYESPVTATYNFVGVGGSRNNVDYTSGTSLTAEGRYIITATDAAGNSSSTTLYVDKTAPIITASATASRSSVRANFSPATYESPVTAVYSYFGASNSVKDIAYTSGTQLTNEGKYIVTVTDAAGNSSSTTLYVDKTAPTLIRSFEYGNTDGSVSFEAAAYESPVTAVYSYSGANGNRSNIDYISGAALTDDGEYTVTATDSAGNKSTITLIVDRKAPILFFDDGTTGTSAVTRVSSSVSWNTERFEAPIDVVYSFVSVNENIVPSVQNAPYSRGSSFTAEGTYSFTATDRADNVATAIVVIDNTAPTLVFSANGISFEQYTNSPFTASGVDSLSGVASIEIYESGQYIAYDFAPRSENGTYLFRVTDKAGNFTSNTATIYATVSFGNIDTIRESYKLNEWYTVTLPARIFTIDSKDVAGRYSFESYDKALAFAIANEREFRVSTVQGGYMYVSASNESIAQKYDDEATLSATVEKYAMGYITVRQTSSANGNDKYYNEPESLTRNSPILPDYLLDLKDMPCYFARPSTVWTLPNIPYIANMQYTVKAEYLGDMTQEHGKEYIILNGSTITAALGNEYRQGFYLITESDVAGNVERYLIYSDAELPAARVHAAFGNEEKDFVLDYTYTQNETLYFVSLAFEGIFDNIDTYVTFKLEKGSTTKYFTQADELPTLGSDDYTSGKYTITLFDRSLNALIFDVYIAGAAPSMTHGSLAADKTDCRISFVTSDRYNVITGITLYKIEYDSTKTVLDTDGNGTPINAYTTSYTLNIGGKYGATVTDNYRRTVELAPIFFLKGLPSGKLAGVSDGGRTNKNVSFTFDSVDVAEFFVLLPGGERQPFNNYTTQTGASNTTYNITADETTSFEYLVFLHNAQDLSLFVEYTFEIDTILPAFEITDCDGNIIEPDGATNKSFSIKWQETGVNVRYYTARGGSLSATKYSMNSVLSQGTMYYFTIKDDVGNTLEFTVLLDNVVDYTLSGNYTEVNGVLYANSQLTFTVNEPTQVFNVDNADEFTIDNGGTLTQAGRYDITVTDNYRNTITIAIVLDFDPPTVELVGAENGAAVKNDVAISAFDYDVLYLADNRGNKIREISDGEIFSQPGAYRIIASDYAGNSTVVTFSIDLSVDYTLSVPSGAVTSNKVTLDAAEPLEIVVTLNGEAIDTQTKFTVPGEYSLILTDALGNSVACVFTIVPNKAQTLSQALPLGTRITSIMRDGSAIAVENANTLTLNQSGTYTVMLDCSGTAYEFTVITDNTPPVVTLDKDGNTVRIAAVDKDNVQFKLTQDGNEINCRVGLTLDNPGNYVLIVTDELGNESVYEFAIPFRLNTWAIVAIAVGVVVFVVVLILIIRARRKPRMK